MNKREAFLSRSRIPVDEVEGLLREIEEEEARERAPTTNPFKFDDEHAQKLSDIWFSQRQIATVEQKNNVGLAYISKVLRLGDKVAMAFAEDDLHAYYQVGRRHSVEHYAPDVKSFWEEMRELFPNTYTNEDINYIVEERGVATVWHFMSQLEIPAAEQSPILRALRINAHAFK